MKAFENRFKHPLVKRALVISDQIAPMEAGQIGMRQTYPKQAPIKGTKTPLAATVPLICEACAATSLECHTGRTQKRKGLPDSFN